MLAVAPPIHLPQHSESVSKGNHPTAQRRALYDFGPKFSEHLPSFGVPVVVQHLLFLKATYKVFSSIENPFVLRDGITGRKFPTPAMRVFLTKALIRFEAWIQKVRASEGPLDERELPPLDVLIILHGYRLAPWIHDEDANLRFPQLSWIGRFPLEHIARLVDINTSEYNPSTEQVTLWEKMTNLPFDISAMDSTTSILCPACNTSVVVPWVNGPVAQEGGTGFAETEFAVNCSHCGLAINHDVLATGKFIRDLRSFQEMEEHVLAGTLISGTGFVQHDKAKMIADQVIKTLGDPRDNLGAKLSWSMSTVASHLSNDPTSQIRKSKIMKLLRPYEQSSPFSTDLVYKVRINFCDVPPLYFLL
jgi:hypothetical protein